MQIAVISDIHGNSVALEAVLADLGQRQSDFMVCLGDAIQGGPQPAQVVARLRQLACPVVMGNADAWLLTGEETGREEISPERFSQMQAVRGWSLAQLSPEDQSFIASFQPTVDVPFTTSRSLLCFHGSPASFDDVILPDTSEDEFQKYLGAHTVHILTGGHTHIQHIRRVGDSFYFNPGSVGLAYSHVQAEDAFHADPWAEYAVLTVQDPRVGLEFRRVPFDVADLVRTYRESGRPFAKEAVAQYLRQEQ
jgi:predicted phosphodiesterase